MFEGELLNWFVHGGPPSLIEPSQRTGACQLRPYHFDRTMPRSFLILSKTNPIALITVTLGLALQ